MATVRKPERVHPSLWGPEIDSEFLIFSLCVEKLSIIKRIDVEHLYLCDIKKL